MKLTLFAVLIAVAALASCNENKTILLESGPPFQADWSGTYVDTNNVLRPLQLFLTIDSGNIVTGTYAMDFIDSLGMIVSASGVVTGQTTSDTSGTIFLNNEAFLWRLSGSISPSFLYSGSWFALQPPGGFGEFSVKK